MYAVDVIPALPLLQVSGFITLYLVFNWVNKLSVV